MENKNTNQKPVDFFCETLILLNMGTQNRQHLSRDDIDAKADEVSMHFDPRASMPPLIYAIVTGLINEYKVSFCFDQNLGDSKDGKKIYGRFEFKNYRILIDKILPHDSHRFRWTLCHEIGHLVLHRKLNPYSISQLVDTRTELHYSGTVNWSELQWIEWQANQFASSLLLPRKRVHTCIKAVQIKLGIPRPGAIFLDDQPCNLHDYYKIINEVSNCFNVSKTVLRIRLLCLGILQDVRIKHLSSINDIVTSL